MPIPQFSRRDSTYNPYVPQISTRELVEAYYAPRIAAAEQQAKLREEERKRQQENQDKLAYLREQARLNEAAAERERIFKREQSEIYDPPVGYQAPYQQKPSEYWEDVRTGEKIKQEFAPPRADDRPDWLRWPEEYKRMHPTIFKGPEERGWWSASDVHAAEDKAWENRDYGLAKIRLEELEAKLKAEGKLKATEWEELRQNRVITKRIVTDLLSRSPYSGGGAVSGGWGEDVDPLGLEGMLQQRVIPEIRAYKPPPTRYGLIPDIGRGVRSFFRGGLPGTPAWWRAREREREKRKQQIFTREWFEEERRRKQGRSF